MRTLEGFECDERSRFPFRHLTFAPEPMRTLPAVPKALLLTGLVLAAPLTAGPAGAQSPLDDGTYSISFGFDGSSSATAGVWYAFGRVNMGFLGELDWRRTSTDDGDEVESRTAFAIGPRAKWYFGSAAPIAPFWLGGVDVIVERRSRPDLELENRRGVGLMGGVGADWFPVDALSVGGWTGLDLSFLSERHADRSTTRLRTLTTGLTVHLYF